MLSCASSEAAHVGPVWQASQDLHCESALYPGTEHTQAPESLEQVPRDEHVLVSSQTSPS